MIDVNIPVGMLPPPRVPSRPRWPSADAVAALAGEELAAPIRKADEAQATAQAAMRDLEENRPGALGRQWRKALEADAADHAAGKSPAKWRAAVLLEEDGQRWAQARVLCGALSSVWGHAGAALDRPAIRAAAAKAAADVSARFERVAADAWAVRADPHKAWPKRAEGDELVREYRAAQSIVEWADEIGGYDPANAGHMLPGSPAAAGHWFCLDLVLHPKKKLLGIPKGIVWPDGAERLLGAAIPAGRGLSELLRTGRYEIVGAD